MADLSDLISRVRSATGSDRRLDAEISCAFYFPDLRPAEPDDFSGAYGYTPGNIKVKHGFLMAESFTSSLDAAVALCNRVLPGWWWRVGTCHVSDDATIGPDYNSPEHSERLHREFPIGVKDDGYPDEWIFDVDQRPPRSVALALILAVLLAKQEIDGHE